MAEFFEALMADIPDKTDLNLTLRKTTGNENEPDQLTIILVPKITGIEGVEGKNKASLQPITITGTAAELDHC